MVVLALFYITEVFLQLFKPTKHWLSHEVHSSLPFHWHYLLILNPPPPPSALYRVKAVLNLTCIHDGLPRE